MSRPLPTHRRTDQRPRPSKWCLTDSGLAAHLIGCTSPSHLAAHPHRGQLFEGLVVAEAMKAQAHAGSPARLHMYATRTSEVDLLVEANGRPLAVEIKAGQTVADVWLRSLEQVAAIAEAAVDARLASHEALPIPRDLPGMEARLRACCGDRG